MGLHIQQSHTPLCRVPLHRNLLQLLCLGLLAAVPLFFFAQLLRTFTMADVEMSDAVRSGA
jgi:hypothetical protein